MEAEIAGTPLRFIEPKGNARPDQYSPNGAQISAEPKQTEYAQTMHSAGSELLAGKKVLIVDDDMRNIFALTALLEQHEVVVLYATNGKDGLRMV